MRPARLAALFGLALTLAPRASFAWGELGHLRITQEAHALLPNGCLRTWYYDNGEDLLMASVAPDAWRDTDPDEAPRHFLDIDIYGSPATYPREFNQAVAQLGSNAVFANGTVPWVAEAVYEQLVDAFTTGNAQNAIALSGYLSHYVSDSFSPLHATVNYDGQLTGNPGVHERYEVTMLETFDAQVQSGLAAGSAVVTAPANLHLAIFDALMSGTTLVAALNAADISSSFNVTVLWSAKGQEAVGRMTAGTNWVAALWRLAYAQAGSPRMPGMPVSCAPAPPPVDAGVPDTGVRPDAGPVDASRVDASTPPADSGAPAPDASAPDVLVADASAPLPDASEVPADAGSNVPDAADPAFEDAGDSPDATSAQDSGTESPVPAPPVVPACACDVDVCCSEGCACDTECACACDSTTSCDPDCTCDPECQPGCPGFSADDSATGSSCQAPLDEPPSGGVLALLAVSTLLALRRRRVRIRPDSFAGKRASV